MKRIRLTRVIVMLAALAGSVSGQDDTKPPVPRIGLDISGINSSPAATPATPAVPAVAKPDKRPPGPTEITSREAVFDNRNHLATFTTEVLLTDPEFGLSSDRLTVYLKKPTVPSASGPAPKPKTPGEKEKPPGEQNSGIEKAIAEGHVIITQDKPAEAGKKAQRYTAKAKRAVFDNTTGTLKLYGWPEISESIGGNMTKQTIAREEGCVITLDRAGKLEVKGYSTSRILDASDLNQANQPKR
jgi:lipopolysaccharide export system protein LptA